ncbi:MAG: ATP-binding protein [Rhodocyclaceae bacterium]
MVQVILPAFFVAERPQNGLVACADIRYAEHAVIIDVSRVGFYDPFGLAMVAASIQIALENGCHVMACGQSDTATYLARMDVFNGVQWLGACPEIGERHDRRRSLVEVTRIDDARDVDNAADQLASAVVGQIPDIDRTVVDDGMTAHSDFDRHVEPLKYCLTEVLENALTHARRGGRDSAVWIACQYYRSQDRISLAVIDNGCGFRTSLRNHPDLSEDATDRDAIMLGIRPRISCNRDLLVGADSVNQGVGLTTALRIVESASGAGVVLSGNGLYSTAHRSAALGLGQCWDGVAIGMSWLRRCLPAIRYRDMLPPRNGERLSLRFE